MDWGAPVGALGGRIKEEEPPSFSILSSGEDSDSSDDEGLVMKKVSDVFPVGRCLSCKAMAFLSGSVLFGSVTMHSQCTMSCADGES